MALDRLLALLTLMVHLLQLLGFHVALLLIPVIALFLHPPSNLLTEVHISVASLELWVHSLFSLQVQEIQYLIYSRQEHCWSMQLAWLAGQLHTTMKSC